MCNVMTYCKVLEERLYNPKTKEFLPIESAKTFVLKVNGIPRKHYKDFTTANNACAQCVETEDLLHIQDIKLDFTLSAKLTDFTDSGYVDSDEWYVVLEFRETPKTLSYWPGFDRFIKVSGGYMRVNDDIYKNREEAIEYLGMYKNVHPEENPKLIERRPSTKLTGILYVYDAESETWNGEKQ